MANIDDSYRVNYISADDGPIQKNTLYINSTQGVTWLVSQLPTDNSQLACIQTLGQVYYIESNGDIRQCTISSALVCLPGFPGKEGSPLSALELYDGVILVYYIDVKGCVNQLAYTAGSWTHQFP
jgi:hypothetical protein